MIFEWPEDVAGLQKLREELLEDMAEVRDQADGVKAQIQRAKVTRIETGEFADADWFARAHEFLRARSRQHQDMQLDLGEVNRRLKAAQNKAENVAFERAFIIAAKAQLRKDEYDSIVAAALASVRHEVAA